MLKNELTAGIIVTLLHMPPAAHSNCNYGVTYCMVNSCNTNTSNDSKVKRTMFRTKIDNMNHTLAFLKEK